MKLYVLPLFKVKVSKISLVNLIIYLQFQIYDLAPILAKTS